MTNNENQYNEPIRFTGKECYGERLRKLKLIREQYERQKLLQPKFIDKINVK